MFYSIFTVTITTNSDHTKKPLTKLQKRKSPPPDNEEWELVPPDGGWVNIYINANRLFNLNQ